MSRGTGIGIAVGVAALLLIGVATLSRRTEPPMPPSAMPTARDPAEKMRAGPAEARPTPAAEPAGPAQHYARLPPSFQLASDFHAFATEALNSSDGGVVFEGFQALRECEGLQREADDLRIVADGGVARGMVHGEVTEERRKAIRDVLRRCEGFSKIDHRERRAMYAAFQKRGQELDAVEFSTATRPFGQLGREELIGLLESSSPAARHLALISLPAHPSEAPPEEGAAAKAFDTARGLGFLLAGCDLGGHCGPGSYQSIMLCVQLGDCGKAFMEGWQKEYGEAQIARVDAFRRQILDAVRTRDYSKLGL